MDSVLATVGVAVVVFVSTNVDDLLLLAAFFATRELRPRAVVVGQFLGIAVLTAASAIAALAALVVPDGWLGLLGLAPLALGVRGLWRLARDSADDDGGDDGDAHAPAAAPTGASQALAVAAVTIANGGDNLGVYVPLFARDATAIPVHAAVFAVMTAGWCLVSWWLVHHPVVGTRIRRYGHVVLPFVLVALGLWILADARVLLS